MSTLSPSVAWDLVHARSVPVWRVAQRHGLPRPGVLALLAAHKPVADAREAAALKRAASPRDGGTLYWQSKASAFRVDRMVELARQGLPHWAIGERMGEPEERVAEFIGRRRYRSAESVARRRLAATLPNAVAHGRSTPTCPRNARPAAATT